jgi:hypothetical protein
MAQPSEFLTENNQSFNLRASTHLLHEQLKATLPTLGAQ